MASFDVSWLFLNRVSLEVSASALVTHPTSQYVRLQGAFVYGYFHWGVQIIGGASYQVYSIYLAIRVTE